MIRVPCGTLRGRLTCRIVPILSDLPTPSVILAPCNALGPGGCCAECLKILDARVEEAHRGEPARSEPARIGGIGPRIMTVTVPTCNGCPALRTRTYRDEQGIHTEAYCGALGAEPRRSFGLLVGSRIIGRPSGRRRDGAPVSERPMTEDEWTAYASRLVLRAAEQGRCRGLNEAAKIVIDNRRLDALAIARLLLEEAVKAYDA